MRSLENVKTVIKRIMTSLVRRIYQYLKQVTTAHSCIHYIKVIDNFVDIFISQKAIQEKKPLFTMIQVETEQKMKQ